MIKIGVIGAGGNTISAHLPKLIDQKDVEVIAVANRTISSGNKVAKKFNIKHVYRDWQEVIINDEVDAICIGTWPYMHATISIEALESGKHVLTEARMAMDSDEAEAMFNVSKNYPELITQIVPAPHTLPYDKTIKNWVANEMGDLIFFDVKSTTGEFIDYDREIHWRENRDLSGNNIMHMGIFYESAMRWLGTASSVMAVSNVNVKKRHSSETGHLMDISIPDHLEAIGEMNIGGNFHLSHSTVLGGAEKIEINIYGTNSTLRISEDPSSKILQSHNTSKLKMEILNKNSNKWKELKPKKSQIGKWRVEEEFINAIKGKEKISHTTFSDGVKYMQFADALKISSESNRKVYLPLSK